MGSEKALWQRLKDNVSQYGHIVRIENILGEGTPDVSYCFRGVEGWIELKHCPEIPPRSAPFTRYRGLEDGQIDWLLRRDKHGGLVFILAQVKDELFLLPGCVAGEFNKMSIEALRSFCMWSIKRTASESSWLKLVGILSTRRKD